MTPRRRLLALAGACLAACAAPPADLHDADGLIVVSARPTGGGRALELRPARQGLHLNAKSLPRFIAADGQETLLTGSLNGSREQFIGAAGATVPRGPGVLRASVCDSVAGVCRRAEVAVGA